MKWFKHDSDASTDAKLRKVRSKYGLEGYGLYFYCLELIARNVQKHNLTFELEHDAELISEDTGIHFSRVNEMMAFMIDLRLFESNGDIVTCLKLATRTDEYTQKLIKQLGGVGMLSGQNPRKSELKEKKEEKEQIDKTRQVHQSLSGKDVFNAYNRICNLLTPANDFPPEREDAADAFIAANNLDMGKIEKYFREINQDPYFQGKVKKTPPAGFDTVVRSIIQARFNEGYYKQHPKQSATYDKSNAELAKLKNDLRIEKEALAEHLQDREKNIAFPESSTRATIQTLEQQIKNLEGGVK